MYVYILTGACIHEVNSRVRRAARFQSRALASIATISAPSGERERRTEKKEPPRRSESDATAILVLPLNRGARVQCVLRQCRTATTAPCPLGHRSHAAATPAALLRHRARRERRRGRKISTKRRRRERRPAISSLVEERERERDRDNSQGETASASWPAQS